MHINTVDRPLEIVTVSDVGSRDALHISLDYVGKDGKVWPQEIVFDATTHNLGWGSGPRWFLLNTFESDTTVVRDLQRDAKIFYQKLPWWNRLGAGRRYAARQWVRDHVQFGIRPANSEWRLYDRNRTADTRGQIIKGLWLEVVPLVNGVITYDASMYSGAFRTRWPVGEVTAGKAMRANAMI